MVDYCTECNGSNCMNWSNNGFTNLIGSFIFKGAESCSKYSDSDLRLFYSVMSLSLFFLIPINICFGIIKKDKDIFLIPLIVSLSMILINIYKSFKFTFMERPFQTSINEKCTRDEDSEEMKEKYKCAKSSGMPSGHASASIIFIAASVLIYMKSRGQPNFTMGYKILLIANIFVSSVAIYSRIELKYHTILQVVIGSIFGGFSTCLYGYFANKNGILGPGFVGLQLLFAVILIAISKGKEFINILLIYILPLVSWFYKNKRD